MRFRDMTQADHAAAAEREFDRDEARFQSEQERADRHYVDLDDCMNWPADPTWGVPVVDADEGFLVAVAPCGDVFAVTVATERFGEFRAEYATRAVEFRVLSEVEFRATPMECDHEPKWGRAA